MTDTYRRAAAIHHGRMHGLQPRPTGPRERHLNPLVALRCGLTGGQHAHLAPIADHAPRTGAAQARGGTRCQPWRQHDAPPLDGWLLPVAEAPLAPLAAQPLLLVMHGRGGGRGCGACLRRVVYHGRALPVAWVVVAGQQGHVPPATQGALRAQRPPLIPATAAVPFLGDGDFDGPAAPARLRQRPWQNGRRTAPNLLVTVAGPPRPSGKLAPPRGALLAVRPAWRTAEAYGPVSSLASWAATWDAPSYLLPNMAALAAALAA